MSAGGVVCLAKGRGWTYRVETSEYFRQRGTQLVAFEVLSSVVLFVRRNVQAGHRLWPEVTHFSADAMLFLIAAFKLPAIVADQAQVQAAVELFAQRPFQQEFIITVVICEGGAGQHVECNIPGVVQVNVGTQG